MAQFPNKMSEFVYVRSYARWLPELGRRETWEETVERVVSFLKEKRGELVPEKTFRKIRDYMLRFEVMPSMRLTWAAGPAVEKDNTCIFNCSFSKLDSVDSFAENLYILMCGTGFGFSVTKEAVDQLPEIPKIDQRNISYHTIEDSREGWADSVKMLMNALYDGKDVHFYYDQLRPEGARLATMGGKSSGPAPLVDLHSFIRETFVNAQGRKLKSIEAHDISNQIAEAVVMGGVRRSSEISLSDLDDDEMKHAKDWPFPNRRQMSNNSAIYYEKPSAIDFLKEWSSIASSGTGERGILNLASLRKQCPSRRNYKLIEGTNPCAEILLRDKGFCNLSEVVVRPNDDLDSLLDKVETATWIGAIQSTFTHFPYLRPQWKKNCEEERLLGVSLTGICDAPHILEPIILNALKNRARSVARRAAKIMDINYSAAITCGKPSGTVSQLVNSSSGIHARYAKFYIRRFRISRMDSLYHMMSAQGFEFVPDIGQDPNNPSTLVCAFPVKSPEGSILREDMDAIQQLETYRLLKENWTEHNQSCTIYVKDKEWFEVGNWVYKNWDIINGLSFLPYDNGHYELAPFEEITEEEYNKMIDELPDIDYSELSKYEQEDNTDGAKTYACSGGKCDLF